MTRGNSWGCSRVTWDCPSGNMGTRNSPFVNNINGSVEMDKDGGSSTNPRWPNDGAIRIGTLGRKGLEGFLDEEAENFTLKMCRGNEEWDVETHLGIQMVQFDDFMDQNRTKQVVQCRWPKGMPSITNLDKSRIITLECHFELVSSPKKAAVPFAGNNTCLHVQRQS